MFLGELTARRLPDTGPELQAAAASRQRWRIGATGRSFGSDGATALRSVATPSSTRTKVAETKTWRPSGMRFAAVTASALRFEHGGTHGEHPLVQHAER